MKRTGVSLVVLGLLGVLFFWLTDPRFGIPTERAGNVLDAAHDALWSLVVGIIGSLIVLATGIWLWSRPPA